MEQDILIVGNPVEGVRLYTVDGPEDPHIERRFANETWWVAEARPIAREREVLYALSVEDIEDIAGRTLSDDELARITKAIDYSSIPTALGEVIGAIADIDEDDEDETVGGNGKPHDRGRCDTCGSPCDADTGDCTRDPAHPVALA